MMMSVGERCNEHVFFLKVCNSQWHDVERLLEHPNFYPASSVAELMQVTWPEDSDAFRSIIERLIRHKKFDFSENGNMALQWAVENGRLDLLNYLMQNDRVDPSFPMHWPIISALDRAEFALQKCEKDLINTNLAIVDALHLKTCCALPFSRLSFAHIGMFRSRMLQVCIALQSLRLPDVQMLKIVNFLIPNSVRRWAKIEIINKVKHFK